MTDFLNSLNNKLSDESEVPLYFQLITLLKRQISSGKLKTGDMVPSESQLCEQYRVSRSTVRQALKQLVEESLIIRRRGKGSFIANPKLRRDLNYLYNFTEDMISSGISPSSKVLEKVIMDAPEDIIIPLNLPSGKTQVFKILRLRLANNEPLLLETTYIPISLCPGIENEDYTSVSLYSILRSKYNLNLFKAIETYESIRLNKEMATLLNCKSSLSAFNIQRIAYLDSGIPFEFTNSITRADKCIFKVELYANKNKVNFSRKISL